VSSVAAAAAARLHGLDTQQIANAWESPPAVVPDYLPHQRRSGHETTARGDAAREGLQAVLLAVAGVMGPPE